jgi:hypothetical protein
MLGLLAGNESLYCPSLRFESAPSKNLHEGTMALGETGAPRGNPIAVWLLKSAVVFIPPAPSQALIGVVC